MIGQVLFCGCKARQDVGMVLSNDRDALWACFSNLQPLHGQLIFVACGRACSSWEDIDTPGNFRHAVGTAGHMTDVFPKRHLRVSSICS